jgi:hypothetical protein
VCCREQFQVYSFQQLDFILFAQDRNQSSFPQKYPRIIALLHDPTFCYRMTVLIKRNASQMWQFEAFIVCIRATRQEMQALKKRNHSQNKLFSKLSGEKNVLERAKFEITKKLRTLKKENSSLSKDLFLRSLC